MSDEGGSAEGPNEVATRSVTRRKFEELGTSSNPIVLGASSSESVTSAGEAPRVRTTRTSRRKCPLGAYVEIIEERKPARSSNTNSFNMTAPSTQPASAAVTESAEETVEQNAQTGTAGENDDLLVVPSTFEVLMRCSICMEIFHNPATVTPCNHKFCYSCIITWRRSNPVFICPQCRSPIHLMQKDAQFNEVVESFLATNPGKRRSPEELESLDTVESEYHAFHTGAQRGRRRGSTVTSRSRTTRERTVRTPLLVRVSQIRAHRPTAARQRSGARILDDWLSLEF